MFYGDSVIGNNTYYMYTKMGGGTHSARRYRRRVKFVLPYCLYAYVYLYLMRRDVTRRYFLGNANSENKFFYNNYAKIIDIKRFKCIKQFARNFRLETLTMKYFRSEAY